MRIDVVGEDGAGLADEARAAGVEVCLVPTSAEAMRGLSASPGDLVLVAWSASNKESVWALTRFESPTRGRVVAALTDAGLAGEALASGADEVVVRPLRAADLEARATVLARRRTTRRLRIVIHTQMEIAQGALDEAAIRRLVVERARVLTDADGAAIEVVDGDELVVQDSCGHFARPTQTLHYPRAGSVGGLVIESGKPIRCDDTETDDRVYRDTGPKADVRSMIVTPLWLHGTCWGVLRVGSRSPRAFNDSDERALELMGGVMSAALETARALEARAKAHADLQEVVAALQYNEDQLRGFMDHVPGPAYVRDLQGRHPYTNTVFQEIAGRSGDFLRRNPVGEWLPPPEVRKIELRTEGIVATGAPVQSELVVPAPGRGQRHFVLYEFLMKDSAGNQLVGGVAVDNTERNAVHQALRHSEAGFRTLIEHCPDAVLVHRDGKVIFVNSAALRVMGVDDPGRLTGREVTELIHPDDCARLAARVRDMQRDGRATPLERIRYVRPDGQIRACETVSISVEFDGHPSVLEFFRDVTDREQRQQQLQVTERLASVGTLAAGVAHEINNPLAWVISGIAWLEEEFGKLTAKLEAKDAEEINATLGEVLEGAQRVAHIVKELKTFSRGDDEGAKGVDLVPVLDTAVRMAGNELKHRARVTKEFEVTPLVRGNSIRLGQVFLNLIVNAAHAIPEGRADENEVRIRLLARPDGVLVEISDTGTGMTPEVQRRIFDPFFTTKAVGEGTGLGLSIVHGIVTRLGGKIGVQSVPGEGTTFQVWLPTTEEGEEIEPSAPKLELPKAHRRGRVLVVDDEEMIGTSIRRTLSSDHDVVAVTRAADALALLSAGETFDVVISDLMMPEMTGMDLHEAISRRWPEIAGRMVFLTGGAFTARARDFLERAQNRRVDKPFDAVLLRALMREMVCEVCPGDSPGCEAHESPLVRGIGMVRGPSARTRFPA
jgi:two-component system NtrC family sensor kinase